MSLAAYTLYAVRFDHLTADIELTQISDVTLSPNLQQAIESSAGNVDPTFAAAAVSDPTISFTTSQMKTLLDVFTKTTALVGYEAIGAGLTYTSVEFFFRKRAAGGTFAGVTSHVKVVVNGGLLTLGQITAATGPGHATAVVNLHCISVVDNDPWTITKDQTLTSITEVANTYWTVGPWWLDAREIEGVQSFTFDMGIKVGAIRAPGAVWPAQVHVEARTPSMTCETLDVDMLFDLSSTGIAHNTVTRAFLRKREEGAGTVAEATAEHIQFDVNQGRVALGSGGGQHGSNAAAAINVTPTRDVVTPSQDFVSIDTTAVIAGV